MGRPGSAPPRKGSSVVVMGLARSGLAATDYLLRRGCRVTGVDRRPLEELPPATKELAARGLELRLAEDQPRELHPTELVVISPGIPWEHPLLEDARSRRIPVIGEMELAYRALGGPWIAVTGTNGKSTTTAMIAHILDRAGLPFVMGGNIGRPLCGLVDQTPANAWVVAEVSSFQLESVVDLRPRIGVLTNLEPDHLDRHGTLEEYRARKLRLFLAQGPGDASVLNADDAGCRSLELPGGARRLGFSRQRALGSGADLMDGWLRLIPPSGAPLPVLPVEELGVPGPHNVENALAALAVAGEIGLSGEVVAQALRSYRALPHRLEVVCQSQGIQWVNDSKATNVSSTARALDSFSQPLIWLAGGRDKGGEFQELRDRVRHRVRQAVFLGECREKLQHALTGSAPILVVETLPEAVTAVRKIARRGDVVLFSPAAASFDQYSDFEARGDHFRLLAREEAP